MFPEDKFHDECGVFGVFNHPEAANLVYLGLYALQLRGQEGAGIVAAEGRKLSQERGLGLVSDIFSEERIRKLKGTSAIGHNRYSTTGASQVLDNVQPILVNYALGSVAVAHNGNLTNYRAVKDELEAYGSIFHTTIDSELIVHLIAQSQSGSIIPRVVDALMRIQGSYSLIILTENEMIGVRDPHGFRPLCLGMLDGSYVLASETCALDLIEAKYIRDIEPGEVLIIDQNGLRTISTPPPNKPRFCIFEH